MHLVSCPTPSGSLEAAPRTALLAEPTSEDARGDRWDGFWSPQTDAYYARCTHRDGGVEWFALSDDDASNRDSSTTDTPTGSGSTEDASRDDAKSVAAPQRAAARRTERVTVVVARSPSGRRMLVGSGRRGRRA